ncbi:YggS family pyridoxal phosphate-dependent enzyme [Clostridium vincentii]|uniref:Pyridoxal phosphate homeostasis protein n=1 Tax=Clostridium vincentii TaxID=52704 RepID=A0A2T0BGJ0_9CLOT|nr:YggS family pyridoxal phosphate-dependent enzyme [Clostridium vincentii]PRR82932.1 alanine racemase [Clostridium vincentii]
MTVCENIEKIKKEIPSSVKLLAVSKTKSIEMMEEAYKKGIRDFGENKVQEIMKKEESFHKDVRWHLIGNLQTNKVKYIVGKVYLIHSLSSIKLLRQIEKEFGKVDQIAKVLLQINIGREESKGGILLEELDLIINEVEECKFVKVNGIMVIIPKGDEDSNRQCFKKTKDVFDELKEKSFNNIEMEILSMGMTQDYKTAVEEGSNLIRVGEGIFGKRDYSIGGEKDE